MKTEFDPTFIASSQCANGSCVEVAFVDGEVAVRDSKDLTLAPFRFTHAEWHSFVLGVKAGEFDLPTSADLALAGVASDND